MLEHLCCDSNDHLAQANDNEMGDTDDEGALTSSPQGNSCTDASLLPGQHYLRRMECVRQLTASQLL